jgi:hypothetical protein
MLPPSSGLKCEAVTLLYRQAAIKVVTHTQWRGQEVECPIQTSECGQEDRQPFSVKGEASKLCGIDANFSLTPASTGFLLGFLFSPKDEG